MAATITHQALTRAVRLSITACGLPCATARLSVAETTLASKSTLATPPNSVRVVMA